MNNTPPLKILVADDHVIVRKGLKSILHEADQPATVEEAGTGQEALKKIQEDNWDVVVLDITLPDMNGLEVLKRLKELKPQLPVVMLSMHSSPQYIRNSLKFGASGYLSKESAPDELITALHAVLNGRRYLSQSLREEEERSASSRDSKRT